MKIFRVISKNTQDHWLELEGQDEGCGTCVDGKLIPIWNVHVICKWDGCTIYNDYSNGYGWDHKHDAECERGAGCCEQSIHICDVDNFIEELKTIKQMGVEFFKDKGGEEYWKPVINPLHR